MEERLKALKKSRVIRRKIEERYFTSFLWKKGIPGPFSNIIGFFYSYDQFKLILSRMGLVHRIKKFINF